MSTGQPPYKNPTSGADDGGPPPYIPASMPTPANTKNQQATTLDIEYNQPSPGMPVPQTHTSTANMGNVSGSGASTSKYGTDSRGWGQPAPMAAAQPIPPTSYYHPPPPAVIVPLADPTTHSQQIQFVLNSQPLDKITQFIWMQLAHKEDISLKRGSVYVGYCQQLYVPEGTPGFTEWTLISIKFTPIQFLFPFGLLCLWCAFSISPTTFRAETFSISASIVLTRKFIVNGVVRGWFDMFRM